MSKRNGGRRIAIPINVYWRCHCCDSINCTTKKIQYYGGYSETGLETFMANALDRIQDPKKRIETLCVGSLGKKKPIICENCKSRPMWVILYEGTFSSLIGLCVISLSLALLIALIPADFLSSKTLKLATTMATTILLMIMFLIVGTKRIKRNYQKDIHNLPEKYVPIIFTDDDEFYNYAKEHKNPIPTPEEALNIIHEKNRNTIT